MMQAGTGDALRDGSAMRDSEGSAHPKIPATAVPQRPEASADTISRRDDFIA
jgi:hypothetical protein